MIAAKKQRADGFRQPKLDGEMKHIGGSTCDDWNEVVGNQASKSIWRSSDPEYLQKQQIAVAAGMVGIAPRDEIEAMIAAQLIACHNASMECFRRAMINQQSFEGRSENLNQANKLSRTYAGLLEALNRHRGKGQQKVTVEHVHVHQGGQAIVGNVEAGAGAVGKSEDQPHAKQITHASGAALPARTRKGTECQSPAMPNGRCRMHGGKSPGAPKGNKHALKHGRYTADAITSRREIAKLLRQARALLD